MQYQKEGRAAAYQNPPVTEALLCHFYLKQLNWNWNFAEKLGIFGIRTD